MAFATATRITQAYAADGQGLAVEGRYRDQGYKVNPLSIQAGGTVLPEDVSPSSAFAQAGMLWHLDSCPVDVDGVTVPGYQALRRSDNSKVLAIHKDSYTPVQNGALMDIFCYLRDSVTITNILQINEGRKIYITADINVTGEVLPGDFMKRQLHIANGHDGTCSLKAYFTDERYWCGNQTNYFMGRVFKNADSEGRASSHRHTSAIESFVRMLPQMIDLQKQDFSRQVDKLRSLACTRATPETARRVLEACFADKLAEPIKDKTTKEKRQRVLSDLKEIETIRSHYTGRTGIGMDIDGTRGSLYGVYNAITQFHTHDAGRQKDLGARARARLEALHGGVASERNARALEACLALV